MTCLIVNGGTIHQEDIRHYINVKKEELYIIGVDGGCEILHSLGVIPHLIIGDFDTLSDTIKAIYQEQKVECITLNENFYWKFFSFFLQVWTSSIFPEGKVEEVRRFLYGSP